MSLGALANGPAVSLTLRRAVVDIPISADVTAECQSHTPTLRDIFPPRFSFPSLHHTTSHHRHSELSRRPTGSFLPGAFHSGSTGDVSRPRVAAMKRWERLVHLELSDISSRDCPSEWEKVREKCRDCGTVHKEIFPMRRIMQAEAGAQRGMAEAYEMVVEAILRWAEFVSKVHATPAAEVE